MSHGKSRVARIRYNLEFSGYEAIVFIEEAAESFSYPSFVPAPLHAEYGWVMAQLASQARRKHRSANPRQRAPLKPLTATAQTTEQPPLAA